MEQDERYLRAKKRVENLKGYYMHLFMYVLINAVLVIINLITYDGVWWFFYPLGGWGIGIIAHSISTFSSGKFGAAWEEKKIRQYMEEDERNQ